MTTAGVLRSGFRGLGVHFLIDGLQYLSVVLHWFASTGPALGERDAWPDLQVHFCGRGSALVLVGAVLLLRARSFAHVVLLGRDSDAPQGYLRSAVLGGVSMGMLLATAVGLPFAWLFPDRLGWTFLGSGHFEALSCLAIVAGLGLSLSWIMVRRRRPASADPAASTQAEVLTQSVIRAAGGWVALGALADALWVTVMTLRTNEPSTLSGLWQAPSLLPATVVGLGAGVAFLLAAPRLAARLEGINPHFDRPFVEFPDGVLRRTALQGLGWYALLRCGSLLVFTLVHLQELVELDLVTRPPELPETFILASLFLALGLVCLVDSRVLSGRARRQSARVTSPTATVGERSAILRAVLAGLGAWMVMVNMPPLARGLLAHGFEIWATEAFGTFKFICAAGVGAVALAVGFRVGTHADLRTRVVWTAVEMAAWAALVGHVLVVFLALDDLSIDPSGRDSQPMLHSLIEIVVAAGIPALVIRWARRHTAESSIQKAADVF